MPRALRGAALAAMVIVPRIGSAQAARAFPNDSTRVVMLGTGTPNADPERSGPAAAVVVNGQAYVVDAGPGVVRRASAAARTGIAALRPAKLDIVFLTHLHSDHTIGLPDLLLSPWTLERAVPLRVFGPPGTKAMVDHITAAWSEDVALRLTGGEPSNKTGYGAAVTEIGDGYVYRDSNVTVTAFAVSHGKWPVALGYKFVTKDRVIVFSGDTRPSEAVVKQCNGCDVLVHEVYVDATSRRREQAWHDYDLAYHTSALELADIATRAKPKLLLLNHQLYRGATDDDLLRELRSRYGGLVVSAKDLGVY
jgi:ribonuclease BN (tRNA processing enzyme)